MKGRSALPRTTFVTAVLVLPSVVAGVFWGRDILAALPYFAVQRVEVVGARFVPPDSVLELASISRERSVWDDFGDVENRLRAHPLIRDARVLRHGGHTLRVVIDEEQPVALIGPGELRAVRADGRLLPIDPVVTPLDLPVITATAHLVEDSTRLGKSEALTALGVFDRIRELDPGLASVISDFGPAEPGGVRAHLMVSQPAVSLALPDDVDETLLRRIRATLTDLRERGVVADVVEARYADQIVVRVTAPRRPDGRRR